MKTSTINILVVIGMVVLVWYGWQSGWFARISKAAPVNNITSKSQSVPANGNTVAVPEQVVVDHTDQGFVFIPVDAYGNVVPPNMATQFIRFAQVGADCNVQYQNRIYVVRVNNNPSTPPTV